MRDLNKFKGCLLGGAAGDALGYAVEFLTAGQIFRKYGENGITEYDLRGGKAIISDDTQMTLFTATGLLVSTTRWLALGIGGYPTPSVHRSYLDWLKTQDGVDATADGRASSWLLEAPQLHACRAPGGTCLNALRSGICGSIEKPINNSKGCGGVMRVAPFGLYYADRDIEQDKIDLWAAESAAITHGHELGYIPAAGLAHILSKVTEGVSVREATIDGMRAMQRLFPNAKHIQDLLQLISMALTLADEDWEDLDAIRQLGQGWVAEETLAIAVYCAAKYENDFDKALIAAVNHDGDSDSTGAVTGNILGSALGVDKIPEKYLKDLELREVIEEIAEDLYRDCPLSTYDRSDAAWEEKYLR